MFALKSTLLSSQITMTKFAIFEEIQGKPIDSESSSQIGSNRYFHHQI